MNISDSLLSAQHFNFYDYGAIIEYQNATVCRDSWASPIAANLWSPGSRALLYLLGLLYFFLGIAIAADIFMSAIERITSQEKKIKLNGGQTVRIKVWNDTVANLTLLAFGSSAPEILLAIIETVQKLGQPAGELGSGTIVGSAAFNLFIITAISILAPPNGKSKKLAHFGVFVITAMFSVFAYIWLYIVLAVWTEGVVTIAEAIITLLFFPILVLISYGQDIGWKKPDPAREHLTDEERQEKTGQNAQVLEFDLEVKPGENYVANKETFANLWKEIKSNERPAGPAYDDEPENQSESNKDDDALSRKVAAKLTRGEHEDNSKMVYRMNAIRGITGKRRAIPTTYFEESDFTENTTTSVPLETVPSKAAGSLFAFSSKAYSIKETDKKVIIRVERTGSIEGKATVDYYTEEDTATAGKDYIETKGTLVFENEEVLKSIEVEIVDDNEYEEDECFIVFLTHPSAGSHIKKGYGKSKVKIIDEDERSLITFEERQLSFSESDKVAEITVTRSGGTDGEATVDYFTVDGTAKNGVDYAEAKGTLKFESGEVSKTISVNIIDDDIVEDDNIFYVRLTNPSNNCYVMKTEKCEVTILDDDRRKTVVGKVAELMKQRKEAFVIFTSSWKEQFQDAMEIGGEVDEFGQKLPPSAFDMGLHALSFPWKVIFAFIPPTTYANGWATFICALIAIGLLTAVVAELASLFGCVVGLPDYVTAISIVALGTSLPDTFASRQAALASPSADAAIGNVTGSNSVNVFLGLGLPWVIASVYYAGQGTDFVVPSDGIGFSIAVFLACAFVSLGIIFFRRFVLGAELGGGTTSKYISSIALASLWILYLGLSSWEVTKD